MRKALKIPRIIRIESVKGFTVHCMFNNGESRLLDFQEIFNAWDIGSNDQEYPLLQLSNFDKVTLRNFTLSWPNVTISLPDENGDMQAHPYEIGPDVLFKLSKPATSIEDNFGNLIRNERIKAGLTQEQLAERSGTTRFYISKVESGRADIAIATLRKIVKAGLDRKLKLTIE